MKQINIRGVNHFYEYVQCECGDKSADDRPVLIFIHGWLLSHHFWSPLIKELQTQYSCLSYDLKGFGRSKLPDNYASSNQDSDCNLFSLDDYSNDLQVLLETLKIKKAWLIGHSLGGSVALWGADKCQEIVEGVVCVNAGGGIYLQDEFNRFRTAGENLVKFRPSWLVNVPFLDRIFARMMVKVPLSAYWGKQRIIDFVSADEIAAVGSLLESTTEEQVHYLPEIVARLPQPVHFIAGKQDFVMEPQYVKHLASFHELFQDLQKNVYEIDNCGHFAMLEQMEEVANRITSILTPEYQLSID